MPNIESYQLIPSIPFTGNGDIVNETNGDIEKKIHIRRGMYHLKDLLQETNELHGIDDREESDKGLNHYFIDGVYARELFIPKGTVIISKLHKLDRICIISKGDVTFTTEAGTQRVKGPYTAVFPSGSHLALYTHEDTLWTAIFRTDEKDINVIEDVITVANHEEYEEYIKKIGKGDLCQ